MQLVISLGSSLNFLGEFRKILFQVFKSILDILAQVCLNLLLSREDLSLLGRGKNMHEFEVLVETRNPQVRKLRVVLVFVHRGFGAVRNGRVLGQQDRLVHLRGLPLRS